MYIIKGSDGNVLHLVLLDCAQLVIWTDQGRTCGSRERCCCLAAAPLQIERWGWIVGTMISNVLRDLSFNQNHPLKSADG